MQVVLWLVRHHLRGYNNSLQTASLTRNLTLPEGVSRELSEFCAPAGRTAQLLVELGVPKLRCCSLLCLRSALEHHSSSWQEAIGDASAGQVARGAPQTCTDRGGEGLFGNCQIASAVFLPQCQAVSDNVLRGTSWQAHHQHFCDLRRDPATDTATTQMRKAL